MRLLPFIAVTALVATANAAMEKASVAQLVKTGAKFDRKAVEVKGTVDHFVGRKNMKGTPFFIFQLRDGKESVAVFGYGKLEPTPKDGDKVLVIGEYAVTRTAGTRTYRNEIDASIDKKPGFGVKPAKK